MSVHQPDYLCEALKHHRFRDAERALLVKKWLPHYFLGDHGELDAEPIECEHQNVCEPNQECDQNACTSGQEACNVCESDQECDHENACYSDQACDQHENARPSDQEACESDQEWDHENACDSDFTALE